MLSYSELKKGSKIVLDEEPFEIIEATTTFKARGHSVLQTKIRNLKTGNIFSKAFHPSSSIEEAELEKVETKFIYSHNEKYVFSDKDNPSQRFELTASQIGEKKDLLKPNQIVLALKFKDEIINITLPIKINLKVIQAPPSLKGERAQSGTKLVTLETKKKLNTPLFVKEGDIVEVNTETGEYVRRIE